MIARAVLTIGGKLGPQEITVMAAAIAKLKEGGGGAMMLGGGGMERGSLDSKEMHDARLVKPKLADTGGRISRQGALERRR